VRSLELAQKVGAKVCGVVGRDGGYTAQVADACVVIPPANDETITPHTEGFQAIIYHFNNVMEVLLIHLLKIAPKIIIAEPIKNLTNSNKLLSYISKKMTNAGKGTE
jgi:hypothetical protein